MPSVLLAQRELSEGRPVAARDRLLPVLGQHGVPREAYEILAEAAHALALAELVALADDARQVGVPVDEQIDRHLDEALAERPGSARLHRALARHLAIHGGSPQELQAACIAHLDAIADRFELPGRQRLGDVRAELQLRRLVEEHGEAAVRRVAAMVLG